MPKMTSIACPECGKTMAHGFLRAESYIGGAKWTAKKTRLGSPGDRLVNPDGFGFVYLEGYRCPGCRFLALHY